MANEILQSQAELANLFEDSLLALTEEGEKRAAALQRKAAELKKKVHDLEMLFAFVKKLMDANAEVCFLAGAHFASTQSSERLHSAEKVVTDLFDRARLCELDVARAQESHIRKVATLLQSQQEGEGGSTGEDNTESKDEEKPGE